MAQAKHKKSKPQRKQQTTVKKQGKQGNIAQFRLQVDGLGLKIVEVISDGNCFFRSLADQLEGNEEAHEKYRSMVVQYIKMHRKEFEPFIEDEVPFDEYCKSMEEDGTWAGNMELQAASLVTRSNICIHRNMSPRWYIRNFNTHGVRMIHLSYHDGEHYNSVRLKEDPGGGPAKNIIIKADSEGSLTSNQTKTTINNAKVPSGGRDMDMSSINLVMAGTGRKKHKVERVLRDVDGDVDAAIEYLIAEKQMTEESSSDDELPCEIQNNISCWNDEATLARRQEMDLGSGVSTSNLGSSSDFGTQRNNEESPENKLCSCGSRKMHKACSQSSVEKPNRRSQKKSRVSASTLKNERRDRKKGESHGPAHGTAVLPNVGALCI